MLSLTKNGEIWFENKRVLSSSHKLGGTQQVLFVQILLGISVSLRVRMLLSSRYWAGTYGRKVLWPTLERLREFFYGLLQEATKGQEVRETFLFLQFPQMLENHILNTIKIWGSACSEPHHFSLCVSEALHLFLHIYTWQDERGSVKTDLYLENTSLKFMN